MPKAAEPLKLLQQKARENQEVLDLLYAVAQDMSFRRPPSFLLDQTLGRVAKVMRVEAASLLLLNDETGCLDFAVVKGLNAQALKELDMHLKPEEGIAGWAFARNAAVIINDPENDPRFKARADWLTGFKTWNLLAAPIRLGGKPFAVLEVVNRRKKEPFTEEDGDLLSAIAFLLTTTLDNVRTLSTMESSQAHFHALLENMPGGFVGVDQNGHVTHVNPRAASLLGWGAPPLGLPMKEAFKDVKEFVEVLAQVLAEGKPVVRQSLELASRHWGPRLFGYTAFPLLTANHDVLGAGLLFQDITSK